MRQISWHWWGYSDGRNLMIGREWDRFTAHFWFIGWDHLSLGIHVWPPGPNVELHLPGGFIRIGVPQRWREFRMSLADMGLSR